MSKEKYSEKKLENTELPEKHKEVLRKYFRFLRFEGGSIRTYENHVVGMIFAAEALKESDLSNLEEEDVYIFVERLEAYRFKYVYENFDGEERTKTHRRYYDDPGGEPLAESSKQLRKIAFKKFLKWSKKPELYDMIKTKTIRNVKNPEEIKTKDEILQLIEGAKNPRDRAMVACFYESGARRGEQHRVQLKHLKQDEYGILMHFPDGKTGSRNVRLIFSAPYIREWLKAHPKKDDPEAYLWCTLDHRATQLSEVGIRAAFKELKKRTGITKKVNPHSFRHDRSTHLARHMTEQEMKAYLGWCPGSTMPATYVHLSGKDVDDAVFKMYGIKQEEDEVDTLKPGTCPRCGEMTEVKAKFCSRCGMPLTKKVAAEMQGVKEEGLKFIQGNPEYAKALIELLEERIGSGKGGSTSKQ